MLQETQLIIFAGHSCKYMHCICFQNIIFWKHLFEDYKNERKRKSLWGSRAGQHVSYAVVTSWENTFQVEWSLFEQKCLCGKMWTWIELKPDLMYSSWRCVKKEKKIFSHFESSAPLLSPTVLPAGPADRLLQLCLTLIGCFSSFLTGFGQCVSYFTPDVSVSTFCHVRVGCLPVSQWIRKTAQDQWD